MIDRYQLRYFLAVIEAGNFSRAAERLSVTQPSLSVGIVKLERALGCRLFERSNRRVQLTEAGSQLLPVARRIESDFHLAETELDGRQAARPVRLGVASTLPTTLIAAVVEQYHAGHSGRDLEVVEGAARDMPGRVLRRRIDVALTVLPGARSGLAWEPLFSEGYVMALPASHRFAGRSALQAEELAGEVMMVRQNCEALSEVSRYFIARGVRPAFSYRSSNDDRILAMVAAGLGLTVVPESYCDPGITHSHLIDFEQKRDVGLLYNPDRVGEEKEFASVAAHSAVELWLPTWR